MLLVNNSLMVSWGTYTLHTAATHTFSITFNTIPITFCCLVPSSITTGTGVSMAVYINNITTTGFKSGNSSGTYPANYLAIGS